MNFKELFKTKSIPQILSDLRDAPGSEGGARLSRHLRVTDLTAFGIAAIIGAGIFATIGEVCYEGGPGVVFLFILVAIACGFSAMCYASFASMIPISGSAYTYAYASFGELFAWIIGWDLIIEYAIGNITVAISWSNYFTEFLKGLGLHIPAWLSTDYLTATTAFKAGEAGTEPFLAYSEAPKLMGFPIIADLPAFLVVIGISWLLYVGIKESRNASNLMVVLKLAVILLVVVAGAFYVKPENWSPFMPNGIGGVLKGVSGVFFAYIGFDAISTTAEECKDPQRDLPRAMIYALLICTVIYIVIALIVTGTVPYYELKNVGDPLAFIFKDADADWIFFVVSLGAIIAMTSVMLVFQMGQPRIWMSMSRDKLLPPAFARLHPKYKTPGFATIIAALLVAIPALFLNISIVTDLTSIGTLFAFVLVCGGILILDVKKPEVERKFKIPFANAKYFLLPAVILVPVLLAGFFPESLQALVPANLIEFELLIPTYVFLIVTLLMTWFSFRYRLSLIPVLGMLSCLYLMSEISTPSWWRFGIWLLIGLVIYVAYGYRNSKLRKAAS